MSMIYRIGLIGITCIACMAGLQTSASAAGMGQGKSQQKAIFAGGCFWCMEKPFDLLPGVASVTAGYTGGLSANPTYENYADGGHVEAIEVVYDPEKISYQTLLNVFWHQINPTDAGGQFVDRGPQYTSAIFYLNDKQRIEAAASKAALAKSGRFNKPIVTPIKPASTFWPAEEYHQHYYKKNPLRYWFYRSRSGRDQFLEKVWGKPAEQSSSSEELQNRLTPMQYKVTQEGDTEPPFDNAYWNNKQPGIYVDVASGEPLFSSLDKFDSGTGWPSFTRPLVPANIVERVDNSLFTTRTEVRSAHANSHLGHVFNDGPPPTGLRYCINSAALRFIPASDLAKDGYARFLPLFDRQEH